MLFSQYTWGDFFKVAFGLGVPYYGYVAWAYFREDIREFIMERGRGGAKPVPTVASSTAAVEEEEDLEDDNFYIVRRYTDAASAAAPVQVVEVVHETAQPVAAEAPVAPDTPAVEEEEPPVLAATPIVANVALPESIMFGLMGAEEALNEQSVTELVDTAKHLHRECSGKIIASEGSTKQVRSLAEVINGQTGQKPNGLTGILFGR